MNILIDSLATGDIGELTPEGWIIVDVRDLTDFDKDVEKVKKKIMVVSHLLSLGEKVCVRCVCGINRSNTIALSVLCFRCNKNEYLDTDWDRHYLWIKKIVPKMMIERELEVTAKKALKALYSKWK
jgi:protein-tyrosine phosphatase